VFIGLEFNKVLEIKERWLAFFCDGINFRSIKKREATDSRFENAAKFGIGIDLLVRIRISVWRTYKVISKLYKDF
jgi:hypothetical protein